MPTSEPKDKSRCLESFHPLDSDSTVQENHSHPKQTGLAKKDASPRGTMGGKDTPSVCSTLPYALSRMDNRNCGPSLTRSKLRLATVFMHPRRCREKVTLHFGVFCTTIPQPPLKHRDEDSDLELRYLCFARLPSVQSVISRPSGSPGHCTCPRWLYHVSILLMPSPLFRFPEGKSAARGQSFPLPPPLLPRYSGAHTWLLQTFTWGYKSALKN